MAWFNNKPQAPFEDDRIAVSLRYLQGLEFKARGFSFLPKQPVNSILSGRHGSRLRGRGLNFEELRHYQPGDDIRNMDWKVTNRTGKPYVRVYTEERERNVKLLVDQRVSMFFGSRRAMKSAVAAEVAALAAWQVIRSGDRLGATVFDDQQCHSLPARRSRNNVLQFLSQLQRSNAALAAGQLSSAGQLNHALKNIAREASHDELLIYIGDGFGWDKQSDEYVKLISLHNDIVVVNIVDAAESKLPELDEFVVSDGQLQISVRGTHSDLQQDFEASHTAHVERMLKALQRFGLPLITVDTEEDPLQQLLRALGGTL